jgi:hypothetical protein
MHLRILDGNSSKRRECVWQRLPYPDSRQKGR